MPSLCLFALFILLFPLSFCQRPIFDYPTTPQKATFYIDETNKTENPDGSRDRPFNSLDEAAFRLYLGTFDIILLGQSITITSQVNFPSGSVCIIRHEKSLIFFETNGGSIGRRLSQRVGIIH